MAAAEPDRNGKRLREALVLSLARGQTEVDELLAEAFQDARAQARQVLAEAMAETLLDLALESLEGRGEGCAPAAARPQSIPAGAEHPDPGHRDPPEHPDPRHPDPEHPGQFVAYLYGVISAEAHLPDELTGIDPAHPVGLIRQGDLAAVISQVPLSEFSDERLRAHLNDLSWVERVARAHEHVLDAVAAEADVIPMRLCTILRDASRVSEVLEREAQTLASALEQLEGRREWALKVFVRPGGSPAEPLERPGPEEAKPRSGTEYISRQREQRDRREREHGELELECNEVFDHLAAEAADTVLLPLQTREASARDLDMLLNAAFLIEDERLGEFADALDDLRRRHRRLELELTGPWPAYNFIPGTVGATW